MTDARQIPEDASSCPGRRSVSICGPAVFVQLLIHEAAVGIMLGAAFNLVFHGPHTGPASRSSGLGFTESSDIWRQKVAWRLQIASCAIPTIPLLCLAFLCSE